MQELMTLFDEREKMLLGNELEKLFALQDRPLGKEKKSIFIDELSRQGMPFDAMIRGIRQLMDEDLPRIKFITITEAASGFFFRKEIANWCGDCSQGIITAVNSKKIWFSFACRCDQGLIRRKILRLVHWDDSLVENGWTRK